MQLEIRSFFRLVCLWRMPNRSTNGGTSASEPVYELQDFVVVATRTPLGLDRVSPSVSYISMEEMEIWQDAHLTDLLEREAG